MNWYKIAQPDYKKELDKLVAQLKSEYPGLDLFVYITPTQVEIANIVVPLEKRNQGIGHKVIKAIQQFAQKIQLPIVLRPEAEHGKKKKLDNFYRDLGFIHNKGRNKDYQLSTPFAASMYWKPKNELV